jgi:hypothetical protein
VGGGGGGGGVTEPPSPPLEQEARIKLSSTNQNKLFLYIARAINYLRCWLKLINILYLPIIVIKIFN